MTVLVKAIQNDYAIAKNGGINGRTTYRYAKGHKKSQTKPEVHKTKRRKTSSQVTACPSRL